MTFTELMALDKNPNQTTPAATQTIPNDAPPEDKAERPERQDQSERDERPVRVTSPHEIPTQPRKREIKRHSFELYRDQIDSLRALRI